MMRDSALATVWGLEHRGNTVHALPLGDQVGHDLSILCACGPKVEFVGNGWAITHAAIDGRELRESA